MYRRNRRKKENLQRAEKGKDQKSDCEGIERGRFDAQEKCDRKSLAYML
jgi:hypothetical protein